MVKMKNELLLNEYKRILVIGSSGSGKSWLSQKLAAMTGLPLIHLDMEYWHPGWVETGREEWDKKQIELTAGEAWLIDGNYNRTMELRFQKADMVVFLDINRLRCVFQAMRRMGKKRSDLPDFLEEPRPLSLEALEFYSLIWRFPKKDRLNILHLREKYPQVAFIQHKNHREIRQFLKDTEKAYQTHL